MNQEILGNIIKNGSKKELPSARQQKSTSSSSAIGRFNDCALIEIIHLHDCLRGALHALQKEVLELTKQAQKSSDNDSSTTSSSKMNSSMTNTNNKSSMYELEKRVAARFKVIWSVFSAHSKAEDEFIWPALQQKLHLNTGSSSGCISDRIKNMERNEKQDENDLSLIDDPIKINKDSSLSSISTTSKKRSINQLEEEGSSKKVARVIEQEEYEEDHADEERMFHEMDVLLSKLRAKLSNYKQEETIPLHELSISLSNLTSLLIHHLLQHLQKEEEQCMPLVKKHLSKDEIHDLVGKIMGKRSSDIVQQILSMAIQNLPNKEKDEMVNYMKQAMVGTFFERWLIVGGFSGEDVERVKDVASSSDTASDTASATAPSELNMDSDLGTLIRTIAKNTELSNEEKSKTIQQWHDSQRKQRYLKNNTSIVCTGVRVKRNTPARSYYKTNLSNGKVELVYNDDYPITKTSSNDIPLFSASELAPTYHDGATGAVLGCPHYARSCKLRHPTSGRLYTCRLCCEQEREMPVKDVDSPLDRYDVTEVLCMICGTLQPSSPSCINPTCHKFKKNKFAKYSCQICNFYDDSPTKSVYHCPFCNVCRSGKGLGIDFRHCMRCNACVSLKDDNHVCIPQRLQGNCPICHESMFESTKPLRGLRCGHVMHLSCFRSYYMRGQRAYTCPLCKKSIEDMKDYFSLLDTAVRMQPMPDTYLDVRSTIYCQDCGKQSNVVYHFVGCKCLECGSYNTREIERTST